MQKGHAEEQVAKVCRSFISKRGLRNFQTNEWSTEDER